MADRTVKTPKAKRLVNTVVKRCFVNCFEEAYESHQRSGVSSIKPEDTDTLDLESEGSPADNSKSSKRTGRAAGVRHVRESAVLSPPCQGGGAAKRQGGLGGSGGGCAPSRNQLGAAQPPLNGSRRCRRAGGKGLGTLLLPLWGAQPPSPPNPPLSPLIRGEIARRFAQRPLCRMTKHFNLGLGYASPLINITR